MSFVRTRNFKKESLNEELYYTIRFPLVDFAKQINLYPLTTYQRKKLFQFFNKLQGLLTVYNWFTDLEFRSSLIFPVVRIKNKTSKHSKLMVHITVSESFYNVNYPFYFSKSFYTFKNTYDFRLKFAIIQSISTQLSTRKVLYLEDLWNTLNNQNKTSMKDNLIQQFKHLEANGFIQNQFDLLQNDEEIIQVHQLIRELINSTKQLIFYENIK